MMVNNKKNKYIDTNKNENTVNVHINVSDVDIYIQRISNI